MRWSILWTFVLVAILAPEFYALGTGHSEFTASYFVRQIRFDALGRFVFLPLWCWLTLHFALAPKWAGVHPGWRDLIALGVGIAWAVLEARGVIR